MKKNNDWPILTKQPNLTYLDSGATTLKPIAVIEAVDEYYAEYSGNIHRGLYDISEKATGKFEEVREKVKKFINGGNGEVVFTSGTTSGLNMIAWGYNQINEGDEIVITEIEHHSNLVPWQQLAIRKKASLKYVEYNEKNGRLDWNNLEKLITSKTKILAVTAVSNVTGEKNKIKEIVARARSINPKILAVVDAAQAIAHQQIDAADWDVDVIAFSGHKMYGPTGVGGLWIRKNRLEEIEVVNFGGGMISEVGKWQSTWAEAPWRYEAGTPPIAEVIGMGVAIDWLQNYGMERIENEEKIIIDYALENLRKVEGLRIFTTGESGIMAMELEGIHAHDVAEILNREGIAVRAGHHCAQVLHSRLGVVSTFRISLGVYNNVEDIDKLVNGLDKVKQIFK